MDSLCAELAVPPESRSKSALSMLVHAFSARACPGYTFYAVAFVNRYQGIAVGSSGLLYRTSQAHATRAPVLTVPCCSDQGASWTQVLLLQPSGAVDIRDLNDVAYVNKVLCFALLRCA